MSDELAQLAHEITSSSARPAVVGISGAVAVGKTTVATQIADRIAASGTTVQVISTDAFLFPNAVLAERDLVMRKGFPESYDFGAMVSAIAAVRRGERIEIPVYSHATYDLVPDVREPVGAVDVLIVEGVVALQPPVRDVLDVAVYVEAPEEVVRGWFVERFLRFTADARSDPASFYHGMSALDEAQVRAIADATWDGINAVNLHEHIAPSGATADVVVAKGAGHAVLSVRRSA
jgi:type I pantothenate kinase